MLVWRVDETHVDSRLARARIQVGTGAAAGEETELRWGDWREQQKLRLGGI